MFQTQDQFGDKDLSKHRLVELDNGNKIHVERRDPYGFIHCWLDKGRWPDKSPLNGCFTTYDLAYKEIERYITDRNAAVSEIRQIAVASVKETIEETTPRPETTIFEDGATIERNVETLLLKKGK